MFTRFPKVPDEFWLTDVRQCFRQLFQSCETISKTSIFSQITNNVLYCLVSHCLHSHMMINRTRRAYSEHSGVNVISTYFCFVRAMTVLIEIYLKAQCSQNAVFLCFISYCTTANETNTKGVRKKLFPDNCWLKIQSSQDLLFSRFHGQEFWLFMVTSPGGKLWLIDK